MIAGATDTTRRLLTLTACVLVTAACLHASAAQKNILMAHPLADLPLALGNWTAVSQQDFDPATVAVLRADDYVSRNYVGPGEGAADLYVGYYGSQQQGDTIHSPMNCLPAAGWQLLTIGRTSIDAAPNGPISVNRDTIQKGLDTRVVLYWYESHGRAVASEYVSRAYLLLDGLRTRRTDAAIVRVITPFRGSELGADRAAADFLRSLYPQLHRLLPE